MAGARRGRTVLHKFYPPCRKGRFRMPQQAQGKQAAPRPRGKVQPVQRGQQGLRAVGAIHQGKGRIARQRCGGRCALRACGALVCPCLPARGADVQHAQPFKAGVAAVVKRVVLRPVQGGFHLIPVGRRQLPGFLRQMRKQFCGDGQQCGLLLRCQAKVISSVSARMRKGRGRCCTSQMLA